MFYVYVLISKIGNKIYVGSTNNLKKRFVQHNNGKVRSTKSYRPWKLVYYEAYIEEKLARIREMRLKYNGNAIRELKKRIGLVLSSTSAKSGAGFTLIELLIVIGIIGIMAAGLFYLIDPLGQIQKANDAKRKSDLEQLQRTLEVYYNDNGKYPASTGSTAPTYRLYPSSVLYDWDSTWTAYNTKLPKDPTSSTRNYVYFASSDLQSYWIYASLEKSGDLQLCSPLDANGECSNITSNITSYVIKSCGPSSSPKPCNYGVSSPNVSP